MVCIHVAALVSYFIWTLLLMNISIKTERFLHSPTSLACVAAGLVTRGPGLSLKPRLSATQARPV